MSLSTTKPDLHGVEVLVLGAGKSGIAAARLALQRGARVTMADARDEESLGTHAALLRELGVELRTGGHPASLADAARLVVISPGVPRTVGPVQQALRSGKPVWGEIELAARFCRGRIIGITGSNGKSTVTSMIGSILRGAGVPGGTGGNLDVPFCDLLEQDGDDAIHAIELSSFQLESIDAFRPTVAVVLNVSPDHLDRYPEYEAYVAAKARLFEAQDSDGFAILNADDEESRRFESAVRGKLHWFSARAEVARGAYLSQGRLMLRGESAEVEIARRDAIPLRGDHNVSNALAAGLACALVDCPVEAIGDGLRSFRGLPHRLEAVGSIDGIEFYNDSKATNPDSTARALVAFPAGTVHLILGGKDKGGDWDSLLAAVEGRCRQVLLVGDAAAMLGHRLAGRVPLVDCGTIDRAVEVAFAAAAAGDVVLLSPGCASFDQFNSFEERGEAFRTAVRGLSSGEGTDG